MISLTYDVILFPER